MSTDLKNSEACPSTDMLKQARSAIADLIEEVGEACLHLREANDFAENGSVINAISSVDEALDAIDRVINVIHTVRDGAGRWAVWAEGLISPIARSNRENFS